MFLDCSFDSCFNRTGSNDRRDGHRVARRPNIMELSRGSGGSSCRLLRQVGLASRLQHAPALFYSRQHLAHRACVSTTPMLANTTYTLQHTACVSTAPMCPTPHTLHPTPITNNNSISHNHENLYEQTATRCTFPSFLVHQDGQTDAKGCHPFLPYFFPTLCSSPLTPQAAKKWSSDPSPLGTV